MIPERKCLIVERIRFVQNTDGTAVVLDLSTSRYYQLNFVAAMVLGGLLDGKRVATLEALVVGRFPATNPQTVRQDVKAIVSNFEARDWVVLDE